MAEAQTQRAQRAKVPKHSNLAVYKPLPSDYKSGNHYWFYGWATTDNILKMYLIKHNIPVPKDAMSATVRAMRDLEEVSGYRFINFVGGKVDDEAEKQGRVIQTEEGPSLDLLAISCTRSKRLFWRRPTPRELGILIRLLGEEPRWFEDCETKENFEMDLME